PSATPAGQAASPGGAPAAPPARALAFEVNAGQTDARVNFVARGAGYTAFLTPTAAVLDVPRTSPPGTRAGDVLRLQLLGSEPAPALYQTDPAGARQAVPGGYARLGRDTIGFTVGAYDRARPLVIDPTVSYATYLGGSAPDSGLGVAVDASGNAYVTGQTQS